MVTSQAPGEEPGEPVGEPAGAHPAKLALREQISTARRRLPVAEIAVRARALTGHVLEAQEVRGAASVAAYASIGTEPGTTWLLDALLDAGKRVLLPVLLPDGELDWAAYAGSSSLAAASLGLREPTGPRLGVGAAAGAGAILVPGLAVSSLGLRLGRGGGSYDRALERVPVGTFTCVLLYDEETDRDVPGEPHDRAVRAVATPSGLRRFSGG